VVKRFSPERCDWLFVLVADGRRWFIPAKEVAGASCILLGGPKYAAYEVEPGRPLTEAIAA
jgi:ABC-type hemin transport system substrate-binding protein